MTLVILIVVLVLLLGGTGYGYSRRSDWGVAPVGGLGTILLILILLWAFGIIHV